MKRVLMSDAAAASVNRMRDSIGSYEAAKIQIANAQCRLAEMLNHGRDEESDLSEYSNGIIETMVVLSDYSSLIDQLNESRDRHSHIYGLLENQICRSKYDYAPDEKQLEAIGKLLKEEDVNLTNGRGLDELTFIEIAESAGMDCETLYKKIQKFL